MIRSYYTYLDKSFDEIHALNLLVNKRKIEKELDKGNTLMDEESKKEEFEYDIKIEDLLHKPNKAKFEYYEPYTSVLKES